MRAYLAGAIEYAPDRGKAWRDEMAAFCMHALNHTCYNPLVEESKYLSPAELASFRQYKATDTKYFQQLVRRLIDGDLAALQNSIDYVICYWDEYATRGGGTYGELTFAYWRKIPVYMVTKLPLESISSWVIGCVSEIFTSLEELKQFLLQRYQG
jgi:hypothetical protein